MKTNLIILMSLLTLMSFNGNAENINIPNEDITETQSHSFSCGAMALSQLINSASDRHVSEADIMREIRTLTGNEEDDYSIQELEGAANKLGFRSQAKKVPPDILPNLKQPVVLLIGLNTENLHHFVVLKGIVDEVAYLYDPARKHIRLPYKDLIKQSINKKFQQFYILAIKSSSEKIRNSPLYLSSIKMERDQVHYTEEQANALTSVTLTKSNQLIVDYTFNTSLENNRFNGLKTSSQTYNHTLNARYGISNNIQIGGAIEYSDNTTDISFDNIKFSSNNSNRRYSLHANHRFKIDDTGKTNLILGTKTSYAENNDVFGGGINIDGYQNTEFAQFILGGSFEKEFSHNQLADDSLPDFFYTGSIGAYKPIGDRYQAAVNFAVNDGKSKNKSEKYDLFFSLTSSLTYVVNKQLQLSPVFTYSFGSTEEYQFGINIAYIGGW